MLNFIPRFAYYQRLSSHMKIRKTLERENRKPKKYLLNYYVPFIPKWQKRIVDNKKKSLFFLVCFGLFCYYDGIEYVISSWRQKEPLSNKLRRWIFKEKNLPKQTLIEFQPNSQLSQNTLEQLKAIYLSYEDEMKFGISRKFMFEVYEDLQLFQKDEERLGFYRQSGYYKKRNQKVASVHFAQFVKIFEDALKKLKKRKEPITESDLVDQFIEKCSEKSEQIKAWEQKIQKKRQDYVKLLPELQDQKNDLIRQMLSKNPYISEEEIEKELESKGLYGLGTKDKLVIYDLQLTLHKLLLDSKRTKLTNSILFGQSTLSAEKEKKVREKIRREEEKVNSYQAKRDEIAARFKVLFKKQEIFDI